MDTASFIFTVLYLINNVNNQSGQILHERLGPGVQSEAVISLKRGIRQPALLPRASFLLSLSHSWRPVQHLPQARWWCRRRQEQQKPARTICCSRCRLIVSASQGSGGACQRYLGGNKYLHSAAALSREQPRNTTGQSRNKERAASRSEQTADDNVFLQRNK